MLIGKTTSVCPVCLAKIPAKKVQRCPAIIAATYEKVMEILEERGLS